jgi:hypothetical protein
VRGNLRQGVVPAAVGFGHCALAIGVAGGEVRQRFGRSPPLARGNTLERTFWIDAALQVFDECFRSKKDLIAKQPPRWQLLSASRNMFAVAADRWPEARRELPQKEISRQE